MPNKKGFLSQRQLATCFSRQLTAETKGVKWSWDCKKNLLETPDPRCLPSLVGHGSKHKCRTLKPNEKIIGPIHKGPRGGYYFMAGDVKVYVPRNKKVIEHAIKKYGYS